MLICPALFWGCGLLPSLLCRRPIALRSFVTAPYDCDYNHGHNQDKCRSRFQVYRCQSNQCNRITAEATVSWRARQKQSGSLVAMWASLLIDVNNWCWSFVICRVLCFYTNTLTRGCSVSSNQILIAVWSLWIWGLLTGPLLLRHSGSSSNYDWVNARTCKLVTCN